MQVKIDTKEKYHVISIQETDLSVNMTDDIRNSLLTFLNNPVKNVVLSLKDIKDVSDAAAAVLINVQQNFYEQNCSFVICDLSASVEEALDQKELLEIMNVVPTISEAGDIVQMEEIERDLMD